MWLFDWVKSKASKPQVEWIETWELENPRELEICHVYRCEYRGLQLKAICNNRWSIWSTYYFKDGKCIARKGSISHRDCPKQPSLDMADKIIAGLECLERMKAEGNV